MPIQFLEPLGRAWNRMKEALFKPFELRKWFIIGFNAFLAGLTQASNGSGGSRSQKDVSFREFLDFPNRAWQWLGTISTSPMGTADCASSMLRTRLALSR